MEEIKQDNMTLWNRYAQPPAEALKEFNNGSFSGTDISPMWRIRCLTQEFGACGFGWWAEIVDHWAETVEGIPMVFVTIKLYINRDGQWSMPIMSTGGNAFVRKKGGKVSDEAYKMAYTDALGGACKLLGIGGAVYWELGYSKYEDGYTQPQSPTELFGVPIVDDDKPAPKKPQDTPEEAQYRILCLRKIKLASLNTSCMRKFGTDFQHTRVADLKSVMPEDFLNSLPDAQ